MDRFRQQSPDHRRHRHTQAAKGGRKSGTKAKTKTTAGKKAASKARGKKKS